MNFGMAYTSRSNTAHHPRRIRPMATTTNPNDLTRQQLDELDTLLQRMLALPLNKPEIPQPPQVAPPPPLPEMPPINGMWRTDPAELEVKTPYFAAPQPEPAMTLSPAVTPSGLTRPGPSAFAVVPPPGTGTLRGVDAPATPAGFVPVKLPNVSAPVQPLGDVNPFLLPPPGSASVATKPAPAKGASVPVVMWPVFGVNTILEFFLKLLGPIGTVLLKPSMKMLLGFAGLALLAAAGAWTALGMGWVQWPQ
jgi:hypothetical protein